MKSLLVASCLACLLLAVAVLCREDKYPTNYDNMDVDAILNNERLLTNFINCLLGKVDCTPQGTFVKERLPDALKTECAKCSNIQRELIKKVINYLITNRKEDWSEMMKIYDPIGEYRQKYGEDFKSLLFPTGN